MPAATSRVWELRRELRDRCAQVSHSQGLAAGLAVLLLTSCGGGGNGGDAGGGGVGGGGGGSSGPPPLPVGQIVFPPPQSFSESGSITVLGTAQVAGSQTPLKVSGVDAASSNGFANWTAQVRLVPGQNRLTLTTQDGTRLAEAVVENGADLRSPAGIAVDVDGGRALVTDYSLGSVVAVDLGTGARTVFSNGSVPNADNAFAGPFDVEVDAVGGRALVLDVSAGSDFGRLVSVELGSGQRKVITGGLVDPSDMTVDAANVRALVANSLNPVLGVTEAKLIGVDLTTGAMSPFSDRTVPDAVEPFTCTQAIALDSVRSRALVVDCGKIVAVDLTSGGRSIVAGPDVPAITPPIVVDEPNARAFVGGPVDVNLMTGERNPLSNAPVGAFRFALDPARNRLLATEFSKGEVTAIDLATQAVTTLTSAHVPNSDNRLRRITPLCRDRCGAPSCACLRRRLFVAAVEFDRDRSRDRTAHVDLQQPTTQQR